MDGRDFPGHGFRVKMFRNTALALLCTGPLGFVAAAAVDNAAQEVAGLVAGIRPASGVRLAYNPGSLRLEARDDAGNLLEEISSGSTGKRIGLAGQEYQISFGKDDLGRPSIIVRPGSSMNKPILLEIYGQKAVLSPLASLTITLVGKKQVAFEPSICGEVYFIEESGPDGRKVGRLAVGGKEFMVGVDR